MNKWICAGFKSTDANIPVDIRRPVANLPDQKAVSETTCHFKSGIFNSQQYSVLFGSIKSIHNRIMFLALLLIKSNVFCLFFRLIFHRRDGQWHCDRSPLKTPFNLKSVVSIVDGTVDPDARDQL
jgi:hypothetical protein